MLKKENFKSFGDLASKRIVKKAPAYQWQDLALTVIKEMDMPKEKRSAVFRVCKQYARPIVEKAMNDTKELCKTGEKWKYFFKIVGKPSSAPDIKPSTKKSPVRAEGNSDLPF
jgi:hypothetical protein